MHRLVVRHWDQLVIQCWQEYSARCVVSSLDTSCPEIWWEPHCHPPFENDFHWQCLYRKTSFLRTPALASMMTEPSKLTYLSTSAKMESSLVQMVESALVHWRTKGSRHSSALWPNASSIPMNSSYSSSIYRGTSWRLTPFWHWPRWSSSVPILCETWTCRTTRSKLRHPTKEPYGSVSSSLSRDMRCWNESILVAILLDLSGWSSWRRLISRVPLLLR